MSDDPRLGRIEEKLDKLADAVVGLARMEERMLTIFKRIEKYEEKQDDLEGRLSNIELDEAGKNSIYRILDKFTWLGIGAMFAFATHYFGK
jgi:uncharacterized protein Yka (UPF0111/DUF47 family)